jgi:adenosylcobinamide-GDP ribazoletransferase
MTDRSVVAGTRLAVTTLTAVRLPPGRVDRDAARAAMTVAPLVGLAIGAVAAAAGYGARLAWRSNAIAALVVVVTLAALTGLLHLDGLADTADGVGAPPGRDRLSIMKSPGVGAFGVVTVVLTLATQTLALAACFAAGLGTIAILTAVAASRLTITLGCLPGVPAARSDGLGAVVAGSVRPAAAASVTLVTAAALAAITEVHDGSWDHVGRVMWSLLAGLVVGSACHLIAVRRLGGITGDVLGAGVELSTAAALLAMCIRP